MQLIHFFTSITTNYLPKARVLAESIKRLHPEANFHLVLCDKVPDFLITDKEPFDSILPIESLPIPNQKSWIFKHTLVEMCTGVKGLAFQEIIKRYDCEKVFYLDPDIVVFSRLDSLIQKLDEFSILLTPHLTVPEQTQEAIIDNEICSLQHGVFNLGFLGIRASEEGCRFLEWWSHRLLNFCYDDIPTGLFTDQRWVDLAPAFFAGLHILHDPQYNVATWNLSHRRATGSLESGIFINSHSLCFFHFSGFDSGAQEAMLGKYGSHSPVLNDLRNWYIEQCKLKGQAELGRSPCFYSTFDNKEPITKHQRVMYRTRRDLQVHFRDPFDTSDPNHSFFYWYKTQGILEAAAGITSNDFSISDFLTEPYSLLRQTQADLNQARETIAAMETSKFWKLRNQWFRFKQFFSL